MKGLCRSILISLSIVSAPLLAAPTLRNELGFDWDKAYLSDLKTYWNYSSLYYYHIFDRGKIGARLNHGSKFDSTGNQYEVEAYPQLADWISVNLTAATASGNQLVFPSFGYMAEAYFKISNEEFSLGQYGETYSMFDDQKIYTYTCSAGVYMGDCFVWGRMNVYSIDNTKFFQFGIRRYYSDKYAYIALLIDKGDLPDIGDLPPLNQLVVITQTGASLSGQFQLVGTIYLKWYFGYAHQVYPNHYLRNITEGSLGLLWRF